VALEAHRAFCFLGWASILFSKLFVFSRTPLEITLILSIHASNQASSFVHAIMCHLHDSVASKSRPITLSSCRKNGAIVVFYSIFRSVKKGGH
jgi:hypothetical protein